MSTTLLYRAFGVAGYRYVNQHTEAGRLYFRIEKPRERLCCPQCGNTTVQAQGGVERSIRTLSIGSKPVLLQLKVPRVWCAPCGRSLQIKLGFADPKKSYTRSFERYALELSRHMTIKDVADHLRQKRGQDPFS